MQYWILRSSRVSAATTDKEDDRSCFYAEFVSGTHSQQCRFLFHVGQEQRSSSLPTPTVNRYKVLRQKRRCIRDGRIVMRLLFHTSKSFPFLFATSSFPGTDETFVATTRIHLKKSFVASANNDGDGGRVCKQLYRLIACIQTLIGTFMRTALTCYFIRLGICHDV
jgi:hypothetical protein